MNNIKVVKNQQELKSLFNFFASTFYDDAIEFNEHYYTMGERYEEMLKQFEIDNNFIFYIEENDKIIGGITAKNMDLESKKITLSIIAISKNYRRKGYAKKLVEHFEKLCTEKGIKNIELGARFRACSLYEKLNYKPSLMVQVFDFSTIDDVKNSNSLNLKIKSEWQGGTYGFILFEVNKVSEKYIKMFESNVKTAHAQYIFEKEL